jgi:hypothetical protein
VIYLLWLVVATIAGALAYGVCIRTGWVGCLFVALAAPFAFAPIGLVMRLFEPSETDCDPCGLGFASVLVLLSAAATVGIWLGDAVAVFHRRASD